MTTASGTRELPFARPIVWAALAALPPYCPVCDVSYVCTETGDEEEAGAIGEGTTFVCVRGRLDGSPVPANAVDGEVVEWTAERSIGTRLELATETWQTRVELSDVAGGSTQVTVTVTHEPKRSGWLRRTVRRKATERMVRETVDSELDKLPDHVERMGEGRPGSSAVAPASASVDEEECGWVLHLVGTVNATDVRRLQLQQRLEEVPIVAIDVRDLTYLDSTALPALARWARRSSQAGRQAVIRGVNPDFDQMLNVMGLTSGFLRDD
ncbi:STAS domain-containing protein [Blastococcus sp. MG754426]|uniref:STAS domain-containing protein n=1 Tax=unclassified Blastococcus TaxID=2619396 RepID=UPI001EF0DEEA|nr:MULTISPECIES: STAS domain-containing protein [unclassified Blastococcus]MCF6506525.1 STAS domain-containing protein [Blastococcus sp. MG754426]MCF6510235.1 STAS domain-containing protein [Blastococcus sp. MG754427]MCF6735714.1 STAS domain-containing protein [Blastococcus sp. KM273129]